MWKTREINGYNFFFKQYETGSEYGINGGRVSKLEIRKHGRAKTEASYDRGWELEPETNAVKTAFKTFLKMYN